MTEVARHDTNEAMHQSRQPRVALLLSIVVSGCASEPVGRICDIGGFTAEPSEVVVASPSLDCISRTCLRTPLTQALPEGAQHPGPELGLCTAGCQTDDDCETEPGSPCTGGFACAIPVTVGPFCCQKMCMCRDYGVPLTQEACDPENSNNTCRNLPGRS